MPMLLRLKVMPSNLDAETLNLIQMISALSPSGLVLVIGGMIWREARKICRAAQQYQPTINIRLSGEPDELAKLRARIEEIANNQSIA